MSTKKRSTVTKETPAVKPDSKESTVNEFDEANAQALKDAAQPEAAQPEAAQPEAAQPPPQGACEAYGEISLTSRTCKGCKKDMPEVYAKCGEVTQSKKKGKATSVGKLPGEKKTRAPRVAGSGVFSQFGHCKIESQAGKIEAALATPRTIAEIELETGCTSSRIKSHIGWLVTNHADNCTRVVADGKISFILVPKVTAPTA